MTKTLDKLVQDSCAGCIADLKDIEEIFERMGKMTWGDLVDLAAVKTGENGMTLLAAALEVGYDADMPDENIRELGLPEALSLINKENYISWKNPDLQYEGYEDCEDFGEDGEDEEGDYEDFAEGGEYEDRGDFEGDEEDEEGDYEDFAESGEYEDCVGVGEDWEEICLDFGEDEEYEKTPRYYQSGKERLEGKYCCIMSLLVHMLTEVQKTSKLFRMFFGISIDALFKYWNKLLEKENEVVILTCEEIAFRLAAERLDISIDSRTTIGNIFKEADNIRRTAWSPSEPIEEYRDRILDAFALYKEPLFGIFKTAFPGRSDPQQIVGMQIG